MGGGVQHITPFGCRIRKLREISHVLGIVKGVCVKKKFVTDHTQWRGASGARVGPQRGWRGGVQCKDHGWAPPPPP